VTLAPQLPAPAVPAFPEARPGSRAARLAMPRAVDALKALAAQYGVCGRPVVLRRTDLTTGLTEIIDLPCGATREDKCEPCAKRARRLRQQQCREGWHRDDEPLPPPDDPSDGQQALVELRAHFEFERHHAEAHARWDQVADLDEAIAEVEAAIAAEGMRGRVAPPHDHSDGEPAGGKRRTRSTRRRQDAPDLPRKRVEPRTVGRAFDTEDGKTYRPSMFLTLTLDSYGPVHSDGSPLNPNRYDYRRAAWDAVHFPALLDRFWQNLRRADGWNVQYFGTVEPQRRLAPHAHFAIRGAIAREILRRVAAATYHQVWWPPVDEIVYDGDRLPEWDQHTNNYVDPTSRRPLPTWEQALDALDRNDRAEPVHVVRFGRQLDIKGVLGGPQADKLIGYLTKYLTKNVDACHRVETTRQAAHLDRLAAELRFTPCSPRCPNWLRHGVQPKQARAGQRPGGCKARVHSRATLGLGGRRVLVSRQWSAKTLADHKADAHAWVRALLGLPAVDQDQAATTEPGTPASVAWELARPSDPDVPPLQHRLLRAVSARIQRRAELDAARQRATGPPGDVSATATHHATAA
jgi:hypothetical protein